MIKPIIHFVAGFFLLMAGGVGAPAREDNTGAIGLVDQKASDWQICIPDDAVETVRLSAEELAHYFEKATGARLPVVEESQRKKGPIISLGATLAADAAGVQIGKGVSRDGYRMVTRGGDLYILGLDEPQGANKEDFNYISKGTLYGVYAFLERYLDIRWLTPGDLGEDVPAVSTLKLEPFDETFQPQMFYRVLEGLEQRSDPLTARWKLRNRSGYNRKLEHRHHWQNVVPAELYKTHPEWFAEFGGKRLPPSGHYKLETTNPELVAFYAEKVKEAFRQNPGLASFSLSPTDGQGWSQSAASKALDEVAADGGVSVSRRVIGFYNGVAREVAKEFPDRLLCGYIYDRYFFPPADGVQTLEPNLFLMIAPLQNYGFRLFRPDVRQQFDQALDAWSTAATQWGYYDLPVTLMPNGAGLVTPPCLEILEHLYRRLHERQSKAIYISGTPAFGYGGVLNYLLAQLNWDPSLSPRALAAEYYLRSYGPEAGDAMAQLDAWWEETFKAYYQQNSASYHITEKLVEELYAPNFAGLEKRFESALKLASTPKQVARLEEYGKNLSILQWLLRHRGLIPEGKDSRLYRTDAAIEELCQNADKELAIAPVKTFTALSRTAEGKLVGTPVADPVALLSGELKPMLLRGPSRWLIHPDGGKSPQIVCTRMPLEEIVTYEIHDENQNRVASGVLTEGQAIRFPAQEGRTYLLDIISGRAAYGLKISDCRYALKVDGRFRDKLWLHEVNGEFPTLYVFPEEGAQETEIALSSISTNESVAADVINASGEVLASLDTSDAPLQKCLVQAQGQGGPLAIVFKKPKAGTPRYAFVQIPKGASQWLGVDPRSLLKVQQDKDTHH